MSALSLVVVVSTYKLFSADSLRKMRFGSS